MSRGVIVGPESILIGLRWPVASTLTCVPPTSTTRIFIAERMGSRSRGETLARADRVDEALGVGLVEGVRHLLVVHARAAEQLAIAAVGPLHADLSAVVADVLDLREWEH